ncbi:MAG: RecQ family ATP-dependent DNA helicase [Candidatus Kapabacteria bacterium]|jgi:ATP-dependent DNA helicase RecQ|nr:RecQ family ATP-dependent DNA helicase [Candidatus Kapabacteria bacterium]
MPGTLTTSTLNERLALTLLRQYFGYTSFRAGQSEIIDSIMRCRDTFVVMPTGGGKSLCYQIPALMQDGTALVISPLIALMHDQVRALEKAGIPGCFINSSLPFEEIRRRLQAAREGVYKLIYVAPERLESKQFLEEMQRVEWSFMAVDEAHCVSEWGHDFRPAYLRIHDANTVLGRLPIIALTATATPEVQTDITQQLQMQEPERFIRGFDRPNLRFTVQHETDKTTRLADICTATAQGSNIVYCGSRKRVEQFAQALRGYNVPVVAYHGGMSDNFRRSALERFLSGEVKTIVATNAFGMGVDKPDVRNVVHCDLTLTPEAYYQEAGRAGRDGESADCTLLYAPNDRRLMEFFVQCAFPSLELVQNVYAVLYDSIQAGIGTKPLETSKLNADRIGTMLSVHPAETNAVISLLERANVLRRGTPGSMARVQFLATRERLREYYGNVPERKRNALNALMRLVGSAAFHEPTEFDMLDVWRKHNVPTEEFLEAVRAFEYGRLVKFEPPGMSDGITLLLERFPKEQLMNYLPYDWQKHLLRRERAVQKVETMERYATTSDCKRDFLLRYFGELEIEPHCGRCSSCKEAEHASKTSAYQSERKQFLVQQILAAAAELDGRFGKTVLAEVLVGKRSSEKVRKFGLHRAATFDAAGKFSEQEIAETVQHCLSAQWLSPTEERFPTVFLTPLGAAQLASVPEPLHLDGYNRDDCSYPELLQEAKRLRYDLASLHRIAQHIIVDDRSLTALVNALPRTVQEMKREVRYLSDVCIYRFAPQFLKLVQEYIRRKAAQNGTDAGELPDNVQRSLEMLRSGMSVEEVAEKRHLNAGTIAQHIQIALEQGVVLPRERFVREELYAAVKEFLQIRPEAFLKDIRQAIHGDVEWWELRVAAAFVRGEER